MLRGRRVEPRSLTPAPASSQPLDEALDELMEPGVTRGGDSDILRGRPNP